MRAPKYPLISIIISNYNGAKLNILQDCLRSFKSLDYPNYELILVDNASTDHSISIAKKIFAKNPKFKVIKNPVNMYSQGLNLGLKAAKGEFVAYFNNDISIEKRYFHQLVDAFRKYPQLVLAQGKLLWYFDHGVIDSAGESMDIFGNPVTIGHKTKDRHQFDKEEEILSASGSACIFKKSVVRDVDVFASEYGIGYEDMDLALRLRRRGFVVMRIPSAICYHKRGATDLSAMVRVKVRWHFNKNRLSTMIRNYPLSLLLQAIPVTILIYLGSFIWEALTNRNIQLALTRLQAIFWVIKNLPELIKERREIRKYTNKQIDQKVLKLFAKADIEGKIIAVVLDRFTVKR